MKIKEFKKIIKNKEYKKLINAHINGKIYLTDNQLGQVIKLKNDNHNTN